MIPLNSFGSVQTRLMFCTTGVLLRQLQNKNALSSVTHVVIDEVHERHLDTDVLLGILKALLRLVSERASLTTLS